MNNEVIEEVAIMEIKETTLTKHQDYLNSNFNVLVEIIAELPLDSTKEFKTSIRVNKVVWEEFKEFCKNNKNYTQKDLVSMAMLEYMNKYK